MTPHNLSLHCSRQNWSPTWRHCCDRRQVLCTRIDLPLVGCSLKLYSQTQFPLVWLFLGWMSLWDLMTQRQHRFRPVGMSLLHRRLVRWGGVPGHLGERLLVRCPGRPHLPPPRYFLPHWTGVLKYYGPSS